MVASCSVVMECQYKEEGGRGRRKGVVPLSVFFTSSRALPLFCKSVDTLFFAASSSAHSHARIKSVIYAGSVNCPISLEVMVVV